MANILTRNAARAAANGLNQATKRSYSSSIEGDVAGRVFGGYLLAGVAIGGVSAYATSNGDPVKTAAGALTGAPFGVPVAVVVLGSMAIDGPFTSSIDPEEARKDELNEVVVKAVCDAKDGVAEPTKDSAKALSADDVKKIVAQAIAADRAENGDCETKFQDMLKASKAAEKTR